MQARAEITVEHLSPDTIIEVRGTAITILSPKQEYYISLTDIAKFMNAYHAADVIRNWLRSRDTVEFLGVWERLNNTSCIACLSGG